MSISPFSIYLLSDTHVGDNVFFPQRQQAIKNLIQLQKQPQDVIVMAGDLTHNGYGVSDGCCGCCNWAYSNPNKDSSRGDELTIFKKEVFTPLVNNTGCKVLMCHGNHDESADFVAWPVLEFIKETYPNVTKQGFYTYG